MIYKMLSGLIPFFMYSFSTKDPVLQQGLLIPLFLPAYALPVSVLGALWRILPTRERRKLAEDK